jgi:hypothetical protein
MLRNIIDNMLRRKPERIDTPDSRAARKFYDRYLKGSEMSADSADIS